MARPDPLATYNAKRDFAQTLEPAGKIAVEAGGSIFMVQKHDATRLHWDFRLELDGTLKSWAVTRGPSPDPDDKRLAVRTEDHPLAYATFEGTIPKGQYGGGTVMLWDRGTWTPHPGKDPHKTIEEGHLHFTLHGERMQGDWLMIRLKPRGKEKSENWLLRKIADDFAGTSGDLVDRALTSVVTGRTMAEIAAGKGGAAEWQSDRAADDQPNTVPRPLDAARASAHGRPTKKKKGTLPPFQPPQLATLVDTVPTGSQWLHEVKYDGYRTLLAIGGGEAKAYTRTGLDWSHRFAPIVAAAAAIPGAALIDGEVVALNASGQPSFQALQASLKDGSGTLAYFAFDLLSEGGEDLTGLPNLERKARLAALLEGVAEPIQYAEHIVGSGEQLFDSLCAQGLEGIISKRADAPYRGRRVQSWLKVKCLRRQEFVIVGWTPSDKGRGFRSLLLGLHGEDGALVYAGKVGTGFDRATMDDLMSRMTPLEQDEPTVKAPRAAVRGAHWIRPKLVAEVAFAEFTGDDVLRHASFTALREDKAEADVVREQAEPLPSSSPSPLVGEGRGEGVEGKAKRAPGPARRALPPTLRSRVSVPRTATKTAAHPQGERGSTGSGVTITNPDRVIFPESGITKGQLAGYYERLAGPLLTSLGDRPVSLVRCPQGRAKHCFFQKHDAGSFGDAVKHVPIREKDGHDEPYLYVDDARGILTCVQMGAIEFHGWGSKVADVEKPDRLVFDLDPDEGLGFDAVKNAAFQLRDILGEMGLATWPLLSGGKGVHVVAPLDASRDWVAVKDFASRFARAMGEAHPDRFTANMKKTERTGRIFLDWLRNQRGATAILPYSVRARANAPVAVPIGWDELEAASGGNIYTIADADTLLTRAASGALKGWGEANQALPEL